ncbi:hypothetical protein [uncultured Flavobacterium sp.]|uniref:hypothetical protein n=1 Tax=uncultured Flavobacterium sp. TaxID=165435 RepID=UPI0025E75468|nr:hypothetical protein [uncultured Flavobacterium sp.]
MELKLKPHNRNNYPVGGILIKSSSPKVWLQEMQLMEISLENCEAYAIPSTVANELFGCLVLLKNPKIKELGRNTFVQNIENKLFIPANSKISPAVSEEEWDFVFKEIPHFLHPEIGLFELKEAVNWIAILGTIKRVSIKITEPANSVFIPNSIQSLRVEIDEEALLKELENPLSEEEKFEKLPFNMKKLMNGNQREMEKFLAFMEKNPELALKYALPLDTLGTSRGDRLGSFSFSGSNFFESIRDFFSFKNDNPKVSKETNIFSKIMSFGFVFFALYLIYSLFSSGSSDAVGAKSFFSDFSVTQITVKIFIAIMAVIIIVLLITSNLSIRITSSFRNTIALIFVLLFALYNVIGGIYEDTEINGFLAFIIISLVGIILYRLFNVNATLSKNK